MLLAAELGSIEISLQPYNVHNNRKVIVEDTAGQEQGYHLESQWICYSLWKESRDIVKCGLRWEFWRESTRVQWLARISPALHCLCGVQQAPYTDEKQSYVFDGRRGAKYTAGRDEVSMGKRITSISDSPSFSKGNGGAGWDKSARSEYPDRPGWT